MIVGGWHVFASVGGGPAPPREGQVWSVATVHPAEPEGSSASAE